MLSGCVGLSGEKAAVRTGVALLESGNCLAVVPENTDFSALVTWMTFGTVQPGARDFEMLMLLLRTILPQIGGLILVARR
jgi:hypothetical protein